MRGLAASRIQTIGRRRTAKAFVKELRSQLFLLVRLHRIEVKKKERAARAEIIQLRYYPSGTLYISAFLRPPFAVTPSDYSRTVQLLKFRFAGGVKSD